MIDFRSCLYGLSDVIINRPTPLRLFDQIYMKLPDMLLQAELTARWCDGKSVLYIGDGDAIAFVDGVFVDGVRRWGQTWVRRWGLGP
jgi:hypothetical protein